MLVEIKTSGRSCRRDAAFESVSQLRAPLLKPPGRVAQKYRIKHTSLAILQIKYKQIGRNRTDSAS